MTKWTSISANFRRHNPTKQQTQRRQMEIGGCDSEATPKYRSPPYLYRSSRGGRFRFAARTTPNCLPASVRESENRKFRFEKFSNRKSDPIRIPISDSKKFQIGNGKWDLVRFERKPTSRNSKTVFLYALSCSIVHVRAPKNLRPAASAALLSTSARRNRSPTDQPYVCQIFVLNDNIKKRPPKEKRPRSGSVLIFWIHNRP